MSAEVSLRAGYRARYSFRCVPTFERLVVSVSNSTESVSVYTVYDAALIGGQSNMFMRHSARQTFSAPAAPIRLISRVGSQLPPTRRYVSVDLEDFQ